MLPPQTAWHKSDDFLEVVGRINRGGKRWITIEMAAQRRKVAQPRCREYVVDGAMLEKRRYERGLPFLGDCERRDGDSRSDMDLVAGHGRVQRITGGRIAVGAGVEGQFEDSRTVTVRRDPGQRAVVEAAPSCE